MKVFIDAGAYTGDTVELFFKGEMGINPEGYVCYAFEPVEKFSKRWNELSSKYPVTFIQKAVWIRNEIKEFAIVGRLGSTLIEEQKGFKDSTKKFMVECVDISSWVSQFDKFILKLDVEGAEYEILEKMLDDGTINKVEHLIIEFHYDRRPGSKERHKKLLGRLKQLNIPMTIWH